MNVVNTIKWFIKSIIAHNYCGFLLYKFIFLSKKKNIVDQHTDLLIEGYPRSGNTYCFAKLTLLNPHIIIASHRHEFGHIINAIKNRIPVIVVAREPIDAISSLAIREDLSLKFTIKYYLAFHRKVLEHFDQLNIISFDDLIINKNINIRLQNTQNLIRYRKTSEIEEKEIKKMIYKMEKLDSNCEKIRETHLALPTNSREELKKGLKENIQRKHPTLLRKANEIYKEILHKYNENSITP